VNREAGTTLIEALVTAALIALAAGFGCAALASRPAQAVTTATAFAGLVTQARLLAAANGGAGAGGASIGVVAEGGVDIATLYVFRPIRGSANVPLAARNVPPLRTPTQLGVVVDGALRGAPFALFFSPSGNASAAAPYTIGSDAPLAAEPPCPLRTGIAIAFIDGVANRADPLSCKLAQLDLGTRLSVGAP
jgi:hypothetical protein